jgi:hypothetical protein
VRPRDSPPSGPRPIRRFSVIHRRRIR